MSDPTIEPLLDAIATALGAIDGTGSYETTVMSVNEEPTNHAGKISGTTPSLDVTVQRIEANDRQGTPRPMFGGEIRVALIDIYGYVILQTRLEDGISKKQKPHKAWLPLFRDVERVVKANRTWSGNAIMTSFADLVPEYSESDAAFTYTIRVEYKVSRA